MDVDVDVDELVVAAGLTSGRDTWHTEPADGLPSLTLSDGPHGLRRQPEQADNLGFGGSLPATCFPPAVGLAASWNRALVARVGEALGDEARAAGVHVLLGPGMNIKRSPLCGRNFEYFSEDPLLTGQLAAAMVGGIQSRGVAATVKHFAVNNQETDRMRVSAEVSPRALREIYLRAFEHVVTQARPWAVMTAYNRVGGTFASEHPWLLTDLLRGEWGFDGLVMSDWGAVDDRVAALRAGLDLEMPPSDTDGVVVAALRDGSLDRAHVDLAGSRLRQLADRVRVDGTPPQVDAAAHHALAATAAAECAVLLKNEGDLLPLPAHGTVAVVGAFVSRPRIQGGGSSRVNPLVRCDQLEELRRAAGPEVDLRHAEGFRLDGEPDEQLVAEAVAVAAEADVAVLFLGLAEDGESEGYDRTHLDLPADQVRLVEAVSATGTPVVAVLSNGGVVSVTPWQDHVAALLEGWLLGQAGPAALADLLFGHVSPSGRLTETLPLRLADTPSYLHFPGSGGVVRYGEDVYVGYRWYETLGLPVAYPFGHGLTYGDVVYGDLSCTATGDGAWEVRVTVTNRGRRAAAETVQLYVGVSQELPTRPARELRGFEKVALAPGESSEVVFSLTRRDLATWDERLEDWHVAGGSYDVLVGASVRDVRATAVVVCDADEVRAELRRDSTLGEWLSDSVGREVLQPLSQAMRGLLGERSDHVVRLAQHVPLHKMVDYKMGLTHEMVDGFVQAAARARSASAS